jgi:hypothetical protein
LRPALRRRRRPRGRPPHGHGRAVSRPSQTPSKRGGAGRKLTTTVLSPRARDPAPRAAAQEEASVSAGSRKSRGSARGEGPGLGRRRLGLCQLPGLQQQQVQLPHLTKGSAGVQGIFEGGA